MIIIRNYSKQLAGRPLTTQRSLLLELILKADGHLDADELYRRAKEKEPRISLATVYRNLRLFRELGVISESDLGETHSHYEIKRSSDHHHLVCLGCGQVVEFANPLINEVTANIKNKKQYDITSVQLKIEGYCPECKEKRKGSKGSP